MDKNTFFVVQEKNEATGKTLAYARKVHNCNNLVDFFQPQKGFKLLSINACDTWREAQDVADCWNECARANGNYAFS